LRSSFDAVRSINSGDLLLVFEEVRNSLVSFSEMLPAALLVAFSLLQNDSPMKK
jgi:hypothetical protein